MFKIEDELHAELQEGEFDTYDEAINELKKRAEIPWNEKPNLCPCTNWENCGRNYHVVEYDNSKIPWIKLNDIFILSISAKGAQWITSNI